MSLSRYERWYGRDETPSELRWLRAGPLEVALDGIDLRYVSLGGVELVRRVYVAVRDLNWGTIEAVEREVSVEESRNGFTVRGHVRHRRGAIDFSWDGLLEGRSDGTITYSADGRAQAEFEFAKIGICVHHPSRECAGRPYRATTPAGEIGGTLPLMIGPQIFDAAKGYELPLFDPYLALSIDLEAGVGVDFAFEGERFEMEDQRNWTDASLKTASMPSYLGYVHHAEPGRRVAQRVTIRTRGATEGNACRPDSTRAGAWRRSATATSRTMRLTLGGPIERTLPPIGFGLPSDGRKHTENELERVRALRPDHLRADVDASDPAGLRPAVEACQAIGTSLELALFVDPARHDEIRALREPLLRSPVSRILVFERDQITTGASTVQAVRALLSLPGVQFVGGTNAYFCDINRDRPDIRGLQGLAYSINSQVHAFDERSLVEALPAHGDTVRSARSVFGGIPIIVSPVTLRPRFNPVAMTGGASTDDPELPWEVDPRQMSLFGAVWTLGSVKSLAEAGAATLTYYETVGWRGLLERDDGNPQPELFPSTPGMVFPVYEVFSTLRRWAGAELVAVKASEPLNALGLGLRQSDATTCVIVGNLTYEPREVTVEPVGVRVELEPFGIERVVVE